MGTKLIETTNDEPCKDEPRNAEPGSDSLLRARMPELDTLRGVAVLLVLFFHGFGFEFTTRGLTGLARLFVAMTLPGWAGVNLFFVLSGFLITGILLDTKTRPDYYRRFYYRRALRILPIYYAVLVLLAVLPRLGLIHRDASWPFLALCCVYLANVTDLFGVPMQYGVLWTLAIEEHFYLLWPTLVRSLSRRRVAVAGVAIFVFCPLLRWVYCVAGWNVGEGYTWLYADGLALGAVLGAVIRGPLGSRSGTCRVTATLGAASLLLFGGGAHFGIFLASRWTGIVLRHTALNLFFGALLLLALLIGTSRWRGLVNQPVLQFFGDISYGVYLIHMLVFDMTDQAVSVFVPQLKATSGHFGLMTLRFTLGLAATVVIASLSRKYFEQFFLQLKERVPGGAIQTENAPESRSTTR